MTYCTEFQRIHVQNCGKEFVLWQQDTWASQIPETDVACWRCHSCTSLRVHVCLNTTQKRKSVNSYLHMKNSSLNSLWSVTCSRTFFRVILKGDLTLDTIVYVAHRDEGEEYESWVHSCIIRANTSILHSGGSIALSYASCFFRHVAWKRGPNRLAPLIFRFLS